MWVCVHRIIIQLKASIVHTHTTTCHATFTTVVFFATAKVVQREGAKVCKSESISASIPLQPLLIVVLLFRYLGAHLEIKYKHVRSESFLKSRGASTQITIVHQIKERCVYIAYDSFYRSPLSLSPVCPLSLNRSLTHAYTVSPPAQLPLSASLPHNSRGNLTSYNWIFRVLLLDPHLKSLTMSQINHKPTFICSSLSLSPTRTHTPSRHAVCTIVELFRLVGMKQNNNSNNSSSNIRKKQVMHLYGCIEKMNQSIYWLAVIFAYKSKYLFTFYGSISPINSDRSGNGIYFPIRKIEFNQHEITLIANTFSFVTKVVGVICMHVV